MNKISIIIGVILCLIIQPLSAQKNSKNDKSQSVISSETRKQSAEYADGLRAFYSDNFTEAEKNFRQVIAQNPQNDAAFFMLAKIRSANNEHAGAIYYIEEARKLDKQNIWYTIEMAKIYDQLREYKLSAKLWEEVCKVKSDNEYYLFALAESYLNQEKFTDVIKVYDRLEKIIGVNDEVSDTKANIYLYLNDVKSAVGEYDRLIKLRPYETKYYVQAAKIYITNNMPDKAYSYLEAALKINKQDPLAHLTLSDYYKLNKKEDESFKSLLVAFKSPNLLIEDKLPVLREVFTEAYRTKDEKIIRQSRQLVESMVDAHPEGVEGWVILGRLQLLKGAYHDARITFERALSLDHSQYTVWEDYIHILNHLKEYQVIANNADEILELFPTNSAMLYNIGKAFLQIHQPEKAINYLNQASMYAYENALLSATYNAIGDAYMEVNNAEEALKYWKMAQKKGINTKELKEKIEKIEGK